VRVSQPKSTLDPRLDESRLGIRVSVPGVERRGDELRGKTGLLCGVSGGLFGMVSQVIAECEMTALLDPSRLTEMDVVSVRPDPRPVKERVGVVVWVRHMRVVDLRQLVQVGPKGVKRSNGDLYIDDRLRREA